MNVIQMKSDVCNNCGRKIEVMVFKNTGVCSELCRKERDGEVPPVRALNP